MPLRGHCGRRAERPARAERLPFERLKFLRLEAPEAERDDVARLAPLSLGSAPQTISRRGDAVSATRRSGPGFVGLTGRSGERLSPERTRSRVRRSREE